MLNAELRPRSSTTQTVQFIVPCELIAIGMCKTRPEIHSIRDTGRHGATNGNGRGGSK